MDSKQLKARAPASLILQAASLCGVPGSQAQKLKELIGSASFRHPVLTPSVKASGLGSYVIMAFPWWTDILVGDVNSKKNEEY